MFHLREELILAVEAAVGVVALVVGIAELVRMENLGWDAMPGGEGEGGGELGAGKRGRVGDDGEHVGAERLVSGVGEEGGVGTAGVGDEEAAEVCQGLVENGGFLGEVHLG